MTWALLWQGMPWTLLAGLVLWYLRDRRKDRAAAQVAEQTVEADVAIKDIGVQDARLLYAVRAFDAERASLERRIAERDRELDRQAVIIRAQEVDAEHSRTVIAALRATVDDLQRRLDDALRDLNAVRQQLDDFEPPQGDLTRNNDQV